MSWMRLFGYGRVRLGKVGFGWVKSEWSLEDLERCFKIESGQGENKEGYVIFLLFVAAPQFQ